MWKYYFIKAAIIIIALNFNSAVAQKQGRAKLDSLIQENIKYKIEDTNKINLLVSISASYYSFNPDKGIEVAKSGLNLAEQLRFKKGLAKLNNSIGVCYWAKSEYNKALEYLFTALQINEEIKNKEGIAQNSGNIGLVYSKIPNLPKTLEYYFKALKMQEDINNLYGVAANLGNIGVVYLELKEYSKALEYYSKALDINIKINDKSGIGLNYGNMGHIYYLQNNLNKALEYFNLALMIARELGEESTEATRLINIANVYSSQEKYPEVLSYINMALKINRKLDNKSGTMFNLGNLGETYLDMATHKNNSNSQLFETKSFYLNKSIQYSLEAVELANEIKAYGRLIPWYENLEKAYLELKDYRKAYFYTKNKHILQDSIFNQQAKIKIAQLATTRESELKSIEIEKLKIEQAYNNSQRNVFIISISSLLVFAVFFFISFVRKRKAVLILNEKNKTIEIANHKLIAAGQKLVSLNTNLMIKENELKEANATKDKFFSIISHDLRSPISSFVGLSDIIKNEISQIPQDELIELVEALNESSKNAYKLLNDLLEWAKLQTNSIPFNPEWLDVDVLFFEIRFQTLKSAEVKNIDIRVGSFSGISFFVDKNMISSVLRNLISNSIKFTPEGGSIELGINEAQIDDTNNYLVYIRDTGVGMSKITADKLFKIEEHVSTLGTNKEQGSGLGLILCREFVEKHGGKIWVESEEGKGSTFFFTIPRNDSKN